MTNAMPSLQMTIKLSYGWRPLPLPAVQRNYYKAMYGEIVAFYEIAVHFFTIWVCCAREGQAPPLRL